MDKSYPSFVDSMLNIQFLERKGTKLIQYITFLVPWYWDTAEPECRCGMMLVQK